MSISRNDYSRKHDELIKKWINKHKVEEMKKDFAIDGIVDTEVWYSLQRERILILLKEAYDDKKDMEISQARIWNMTRWIKHDPSNPCTNNCGKGIDCSECRASGKTFNQIAEWVYGIENDGDVDYDAWLGITEEKTNEIYYQKRDALLRKVAIMNVKKLSGQNGSQNDDLCYYVTLDNDLLIKQIELINPTLIICCGTYSYLRFLFTDLPELENILHGSIKYQNYKIIATKHPMAIVTGGNKKKYENVMQLYKNLCIDNK